MEITVAGEPREGDLLEDGANGDSASGADSSDSGEKLLGRHGVLVGGIASEQLGAVFHGQGTQARPLRLPVEALDEQSRATGSVVDHLGLHDPLPQPARDLE